MQAIFMYKKTRRIEQERKICRIIKTVDFLSILYCVHSLFSAERKWRNTQLSELKHLRPTPFQM